MASSLFNKKIIKCGEKLPGKGGFTTVYKGRFRNKDVAIKQILIEDVDGQEEEFLKINNHRNLLKLFYSEQDDIFRYYFQLLDYHWIGIDWINHIFYSINERQVFCFRIVCCQSSRLGCFQVQRPHPRPVGRTAPNGPRIGVRAWQTARSSRHFPVQYFDFYGWRPADRLRFRSLPNGPRPREVAGSRTRCQWKWPELSRNCCQRHVGLGLRLLLVRRQREPPVWRRQRVPNAKENPWRQIQYRK